MAIDKYLQGESGRVTILDQKTEMPEDAALALEEETLEEQPRVKLEMEEPGDRVHDFREVERGMGKNQAHQEAKRCLRCDLEEK